MNKAVKYQFTDNSYQTRINKFNSELIGQNHIKKDFEKIFKQIYFDEFFGFKENSIIGSAFLCGPSGSGKSYCAVAMSKAIHNSERHVLRINCNEYTQEHEVAKLLGAPPGFVGHRETHPLLCQSRINSLASETSPVVIILWDEIEKASPKFADTIMQILDRGSLRVGDNSLVSFEKTYHLFTTNIGYKYTSSGFLSSENQNKEQDQMSALKKFFRPEFLNRISSFLFFKPFSNEETRDLFYKMLIERFSNIRLRASSLQARLNKVILSVNCLQEFLPRMKDPVSGARNIKYLINNEFYIVGASKIFDEMYKLPEDFNIYFDYKNNKLTAEIKKANEN
jgi:ATP-dependent Clp protease ATP-binding subunit ClpA